MWLLVARQPKPDARVWPGRRLLAAVDAVVWPVAWAMVARHLPDPVGIVGPFMTALVVVLGLRRIHGAVWVNHRYRFTSWRWGKLLAAMLVFAAMLNLSMSL